MLNPLRSGVDDPEMAEIAEERKQECYDLVRRRRKAVKRVGGLSFRDGSMIGLNKDILCHALNIVTNIRMQAVADLRRLRPAQPNPVDHHRWCPITFVVAPQEVEASSSGRTNRFGAHNDDP